MATPASSVAGLASTGVFVLQPVLFVVVGAIVVLLVVGWVIALVRKVGGCLIHLLLLSAALLLFVYLSWLLWQRLMVG